MPDDQRAIELAEREPATFVVMFGSTAGGSVRHIMGPGPITLCNVDPTWIDVAPTTDGWVDDVCQRCVSSWKSHPVRVKGDEFVGAWQAAQ
jgi:hypothetical protein